MNTANAGLSPEIRKYYNELKSRNELLRSDTSIFPSYSHLTVAYYVVCRQRLYKAGVKQRLQFIKEIKSIESLQPRALHGVRVHREFCNPILTPPSPAEIITLSDREMSELENILVTSY